MSEAGDDIPWAGEPGNMPFQIVIKPPHRANWLAFDVPRTHDVLQPENDKLGWEQVNGFMQLSDLLHDHYKNLLESRNALANAWQSPAAEVILERIDRFTASLLSDARCARTTAGALHGILETQAKAKMEVADLYQKWRDVTTDVLPEWWDKAAQELNQKAASTMAHSDDAVRDHRSRIMLPDPVPGYIYSPKTTIPTPPDDAPQSSPDGGRDSIPPVPGYEPTIATGDGPELASGLAKVPAMPGQPVSMLPIPAGNQYAPYGGAYILPGPGVGKTGYVVPMPAPGAVGGRSGVNGSGYGGGTFGTAGRAGAAGAPGGSGGMMPMGMAPAATPGGNGQSSGKKGRSDTKWQVEQGVPPVIDGVSEHAFIPGQPSANQEEAFKDWFADLAYPWRKGQAGQDQEPQVILRKAKP